MCFDEPVRDPSNSSHVISSYTEPSLEGHRGHTADDRAFEARIALVFCSCSVLSLFSVAGSDAGIQPAEEYGKDDAPKPELIPDQSSRKAVLNLCITCNIYKKADTHHCSVCNCCVAEFDHHCLFVGNCIGHRNMRLLFGFVILVSATCLVVGSFSFIHVHEWLTQACRLLYY